MKKLIEKILTDKNVRNIAVMQALALTVLTAGDPWAGLT
jgi:hypothetical protein